MRKIIINMTAFSLVGGFLGIMGHSYATYHFWVIMIAMFVVQINSSID